MANTGSKVSAMTACTTPEANGYVVIGSNNNANTSRTSLRDLFGNSTANTIKANNLVSSDNTTPANSTANTIEGRLWSDGTYLYYAVSNNVIKRVTLQSF